MSDYSCIIFNLFQTLLDDNHGRAEREKYRLDNIYTILEKSLFPVKFANLRKKYSEVIDYSKKFEEEHGKSFGPFLQIEYLLNSLGIKDSVIFKRVYDSYIDAVLQISPRLKKNAVKALSLLKERGKHISIISTANKTPGDIVRMLLKELSVYDLIDDMIFSDEIGIIRPVSCLVDITLQKLQSSKKEAIYIGIMKSDEYSNMAKAGYFVHVFNEADEDAYQLALRYSGGYL
jgi:FMN phosphatase YigB (HAD superfamily)